MHGGQRQNIIPSEATPDWHDPDVPVGHEQTGRGTAASDPESVTESAGATGEVVRYQRGAPATINDVELTRATVPALERAAGAGRVRRIPPAMGSEDFSFFSNEVPGFMFRLGQVKPGTTTGDHHTPTFLADDSAVPVGIKVMSYALFDYLSGQK